jgi:hypothetical protein
MCGRPYRGALWEEQKKRLKAFRDEYQSVHDQLDQFWREQHVPHLDLLPVYKDLPPSRLTVNCYDAHPNELANKLAADALDKFLSDLPLRSGAIVR